MQDQEQIEVLVEKRRNLDLGRNTEFIKGKCEMSPAFAGGK